MCWSSRSTVGENGTSSPPPRRDGSKPITRVGSLAARGTIQPGERAEPAARPSPSCPRRRANPAAVVVNKASTRFLLVYNFGSTMPISIQHGIHQWPVDQNLTVGSNGSRGVRNMPLAATAKLAFRLWLDPESSAAANQLTSSDG